MAYAFQKYDEGKMARALGRNLPISPKHSIEICNMMRGRNLQKAKVALNKVATMEQPMKFTRFKHKVAHKTGIGPGRYPVRASQEILKMLESAEANAQAKSFDVKNLVICHIAAHRAGNQPRYGRHGGRIMKRTHIEVVVEERAKKEKQAKAASKGDADQT